jgi:hypothetical protein
MTTALARRCLTVLLLAATSMAAATTTAAESHIGRPLHPGPAYVWVSGAFGGLPGAGGTGMGHGLGILLRPLRASDLINSCYAWNTGLLLQVDVQGGGDGRKIVSGDVVLRRYLRNMRIEPGGHSAYLGLGFGLSRLSAPAVGGSGFSILTEVGLEHEIKWSLVVSLGAQYRLYRISGHDDPAWSFEAGVALPVSI